MTKDQIEKIRHSLSHLMAMAVMERFPQTKLGIGPTIDNGFYYDFDLPEKITDDMLPNLERRMKQLIKKNISFERVSSTAEEATKIVKGNPYKEELLAELIKEKKPITFYRSANFIDLCGGPHINSTNEIDTQSFKLVSLAGAYWRGDEKRPQLQRIYGVAFSSKQELDEYLAMKEEAEKREHRRLGQELELFAFSDLVGPGLPLFLPNGTILMNELATYLDELKGQYNYEPVDIPHIAKSDLYKKSGHWDKFKNDIFFVKGKSEEFVLKPMNCPHHVMIYSALPRSYRDLPVRLAETTKMYRDEQTGELMGLSRVRSITIDDTHIFCRADQILNEAEGAFDIISKFNKTFGFPIKVELSVRDPKNHDKYLGGDSVWNKSEATLKKLLTKHKVKYTVHEGEAAFYGPKIDFKATDSLGRSWQLSTIQLDFNLPDRFKLEYTDKDGNKSQPVMIHIAVAGSIERFLSILIEHYGGAFPVWLSPVQVQIIPVGSDHIKPSEKLSEELRSAGLRVKVDSANETVGNKIRKAIKLKTPYMLVIGDKEAKSTKLHVRARGSKDVKTVSKSAWIKEVFAQIKSRSIN
ncbi:threonine--tRNA ligase [Patescibacteria group bacterium]|nr:threonine--tRNA ligase [Patescibacteria group bacterium]